MSTQVQTPSGVYRSAPTRVPADESLLCGGCRLRFDAMQRRPLVLQCLHSFCETCIRSFTGPKHNKKVTCSLCRATTKLNGKNLPINHNILEMLSASGRTQPVRVISKAGSGQMQQPCSGPSGQYSGDRVTVIPVHKKDPGTDQQQLSISTYDIGDDPRQSNGTTSINVGQTRKTKDGHVTTTTTSSTTSLPVSSDATGSRSMSVVVTMTSSSSSSGCGPGGSSYTAAPQLTQPSCGSCPSSQAVKPCMAPGLTSTVTSLTVNATSHPAAPSHGTTLGSSNDTPIQSSVDLCCLCRVHPAMLTLTSATEMSSQKLCSVCHALIQQQKNLDGELDNQTRNSVPLRRNVQNASCGSSDVPSTTVIKVLDEHTTGSTGGGAGSAGSVCSGCACSSASQPAIVKCLVPPIHPCVSEEGHRGSIHVDGRRAGGQPPPSPAQRSSEVNDHRSTATVLVERSTEGNQRPSLKPTYVSCSKFNLRAEVPDEKRPERLNINPSSNADDTESPDVDDISNEEIYRPLPFNPNFADNHGSGPLLEPPPPPPPVMEALYPALPNEKQGLDFQGAAMPGGPVYPYPAQGPPRYEEIVSQGAAPQAEAPHVTHSASVQCVNAFGKYGELATQPGAFRSPTRINSSRGGGVVVVTDSANRTVQAFNGSTGECLALIRVSGDSANGCSCYDKKKLTVGTNSGIQIYDFNGTLKKTIPIGPVINTVSALRGQGFIAVQPKSLSIFRGPSETLVRTLKDSSKPGPVRQPVPFDCIADAAVNSQEDIVVLDAGAASGLGMILIMSDDGYLKSSIVPGREPCGVLRQPQAVAVDKAHNIIVSDSANRRVLLFAANGKFHRQLIGPGHDPKTWPVGLDISDDGRMFVVAKGDKFAEVRVFSYQ